MNIRVEGLDEVSKMLEELDIDDNTMRSALKSADSKATPFIKNALPVLTGEIRSSVKSSIRQYDGGLGLKITVNSYQAIFPEFGSIHGRQHVGSFDNAVEDIADSVIDIIAKECLSKI